MKISITICFLFIFSIFQYSCENKNEEKTVAPYRIMRPTLLKANKGLITKDNERIEAFIKRRKWEVIKTASGLRYMIYEKGKGVALSPENRISMKYNLYLLDGTLCYTSEKEGNKEFKLGNGEIERGLEEGLKLLHQGDKAVFILPSYLALGLIGDQKRIPALMSIIYNIEIQNVMR